MPQNASSKTLTSSARCVCVQLLVLHVLHYY